MEIGNAELVTDTGKASNLMILQDYANSNGLGASGRSPIGSNESYQLALDIVGYDGLKQYTLSEVAEHWESKSCWIVLFDFVFDVTKFLHEHPGGWEILMEHAGIDATLAFKGKGHSEMAHKMLLKYCIGQLVRSERIYSS
ncbi:cytochrome b5-like [Asterias rubens]|uniref:cytochrome b5-like n=1 Tax=Asterias rubens TaxID=7604 RepID=UPI0014553DD6|nr:cytochrome b5-like [Asterias rubens]